MCQVELHIDFESLYVAVQQPPTGNIYIYRNMRGNVQETKEKKRKKEKKTKNNSCQ